MKTLERLVERIQNAVLSMPSLRPMDIGNRAEINRRLRIIQGTDPNQCKALMVVRKESQSAKV